MLTLHQRFDRLQLISRYAVTLLRRNLVDPLIDREASRRFVSAVLEFEFLRGHGRRLSSVGLEEVFPELHERTWVAAGVGGVVNVEAACLCGAAAAIGARNILEIGTFEGSTTMQLAANLPEGGKLVTVDLDPATADEHARDIAEYDRALTHKQRERIGRVFRGTPWEQKITQVLGDSASIDYHDHFDHIDLAYIDGGHSYPQVKADTEAILPLVRSGGAVFWHDYQPVCPGVTRFLHELGQRLPLRHIRKTQLAVLRIP